MKSYKCIIEFNHDNGGTMTHSSVFFTSSKRVAYNKAMKYIRNRPLSFNEIDSITIILRELKYEKFTF